MTKQKLTAFIIMPFDKEFDSIYKKRIKPTLENIGYKVLRADSLVTQNNILKDIVRNIATANLIVAELTTTNPNVYYELGIAHALKKPTILLTQSIDEVPFDLRSYRLVTYSTHFDEINMLNKTLSELGEKAKLSTYDFSNPVIDFLQTEDINVGSSVNNKSHNQTEILPAKEEIIEEKGLWDFIADGEVSMKRIGEILSEITNLTVKIGSRMTKRTNEFNKINRSNKLGSSSKKYHIIELVANEILAYGEQVSDFLPELHISWETFSESTTGMLRTITIKTPEDKEATETYKLQLTELSKATFGGLNGAKRFIESLANLKGISKTMNRAANKTSSALNKVVSELEQTVSYCNKIIGLLDDLLIEYEK